MGEMEQYGIEWDKWVVWLMGWWRFLDIWTFVFGFFDIFY